MQYLAHYAYRSTKNDAGYFTQVSDWGLMLDIRPLRGHMLNDKSETIVMYYEHPTLRDFVVCDIFTVFPFEHQQFAMQQRRDLVVVKNITFFVKNILPCNPLQWLHLQADRRPCQKSLNIRKNDKHTSTHLSTIHSEAQLPKGD